MYSPSRQGTIHTEAAIVLDRILVARQSRSRTSPVLSPSASGLAVAARYGFTDAPPRDVTIVCPGWRAQVRDAAMLAFLRSLDPLCSTCPPPERRLLQKL